MTKNKYIDVNTAIAFRDTTLEFIVELIESDEPNPMPLEFTLGLKLAVDKLFSEYNDLPKGYTKEDLEQAMERLNNYGVIN